MGKAKPNRLCPNPGKAAGSEEEQPLVLVVVVVVVVPSRPGQLAACLLRSRLKDQLAAAIKLFCLPSAEQFVGRGKCQKPARVPAEWDISASLKHLDSV